MHPGLLDILSLLAHFNRTGMQALQILVGVSYQTNNVGSNLLLKFVDDGYVSWLETQSRIFKLPLRLITN